MEWPQEFKSRMTALLGDEAPAFFRALNEEPCRALRLSPALVTEGELAHLTETAKFAPVPFGENAFFFTLDGIGNTSFHHSGALYVQEAAAMAPVAALGSESVTRILDLCASPGGKSLQALSLLCEGGLLVCNEPVPLRRKTLMQNLERCGVANCAVTGFDGAHLPEELEGLFDLVICDVPCSGEGMMRKNEEAARLWSPRHVEELAALQRQILESAAGAVRAGGRILYSTCTWSQEENEENVAAFLASHPAFSVEAPEKAVASCGREGLLPKTLRFYPHLFRGEGQFLAILRHDGSEKKAYTPKKKKEKPLRPDKRETAVVSFLSEVLEKVPEGKVLFREDEVFLCPPLPFSDGIARSPGVYLGQLRGERLIPSHRFFRAMAPLFRQKFVLPAGDERVEAYLRGEEIPLTGRGYGILYEENKPLGGVKVSDGRGKNLYPKGLRKA